MKKNKSSNLFLRGRNYYCRFYVNDKQIVQVLKDDRGNSITNKRLAEKARDILVAPYRQVKKNKLKTKILESLKSDNEKLMTAVKKADDILNPALTFNKAWQAYIINQERPQESAEKSFSNYKSYFSKFNLWVEDNYSDITQLKDITKAIASEYSIHLKTEFSAGTFNKHITLLRTIFKYLSEPAKLTLNPFDSIKRLKDIPNPKRELAIEEIQTVLDTAIGDLKLLLGVGMFTGLRLGDCATLLWTEINLTTRTIKRIPNKTAKSKKAVIVGLPELLCNELSKISVIERTGFLFPMFAGKYISSHSYLTRLIQAHFTNCGIQIHKIGTGSGTGKRAVVEVGFHSLRHSFVSLHARAGVNQSVLVKLAGHSSKMSEHYTHVTSDDARLLADSLSANLNASSVIDVIPIHEDDKIKNALEYLKTADISKSIKIDLIKILEG